MAVCKGKAVGDAIKAGFVAIAGAILIQQLRVIPLNDST